jgi:hypothetical protein
VAARPIEYLPDGTYLARMNLAGQKRAAPGHVVLRVIEYQVDGGEVIRLLTDLLDPGAYPAAELAALYGQRWEAEVRHLWCPSSGVGLSLWGSFSRGDGFGVLGPAGSGVVAGRAGAALA